MRIGEGYFLPDPQLRPHPEHGQPQPCFPFRLFLRMSAAASKTIAAAAAATMISALFITIPPSLIGCSP